MTNLPQEIISNLCTDLTKYIYGTDITAKLKLSEIRKILEKHLSLSKQEDKIENYEEELLWVDVSVQGNKCKVYWYVNKSWIKTITRMEQEDTKQIDKIGNNYIDKTWKWFIHSLIDSNIWDTIQYQHHWYTIVCKKITPH